ncbi:MAG: BlaI/MecI/CopY family transcriptional regulator [Lachnospiraceae bacterium]|nr:BlaI/MecI/CopY family transcriptional regulator [Lachnospiraceae bacterium]
MLIYIMTEAEMELAKIIWEQEPVGSGELVRLAAQRLNWKKSTTYTVLRKICENGIFRNEQSVVTSVMSREEYIRRKGENYLEENYGGSLPGFVAAFLKKKKLSRTEIAEIAEMIEEYRDEES